MKQLNGKEGMALKKGAWTPLATVSQHPKEHPDRRLLPRHKATTTDSLLEYLRPLLMHWHGVRKCS